MNENALEFFPTPEWATEWLIAQAWIDVQFARVIEPCAGDGAMVRPLIRHGAIVTTNDLDITRAADFNCDATDVQAWKMMTKAMRIRLSLPGSTYFGRIHEFTISNPPFSKALPILKNAIEFTTVAMLLRLTFLEPTTEGDHARGRWLSENPPSHIGVLPRISFTGDGDTDSVTCAWMVWPFKGGKSTRQVIEIFNPTDPKQIALF